MRSQGSTREEEVFEISVDGKLVCAKRRGKAGVYLRMETVGQVRVYVYVSVFMTALSQHRIKVPELCDAFECKPLSHGTPLAYPVHLQHHFLKLCPS